MDLGIADKRALITGAGRGLGRSIALTLAKEGVKVAAVARTKRDLDSLQAELGGKRSGHFFAAVDLTKEGAPIHTVNLIKKKFGRMVSLSGVNIIDVPLEKAVGKLKTVDMGIYDVAKLFFG